MPARTKKKRRAYAPPVKSSPTRAESVPLHKRVSLTWIVLALVVAALSVAGLVRRNQNKPAAAPAQGLPHSPDYHSLMVSPADPRRILLGTHVGIYSSTDGGRVWHFQSLAGKDAMNLARPGGATVWMAGHQVMARSTDGGKSWESLRPAGLPGYDVHGFATSPDGTSLYAAVNGRGLYRSTNGGSSFALVSSDVGGAVFSLAVRRNGTILAGDLQRGLLESRDGGKSWKRLLNTQLVGLAINPRDPQRIIATGPGVLLSINGGRTWRQVLKLGQGAGPVAWAPSDPKRAYVVGFDRTFYRSNDGGLTWQPVS